METLNLNKIPSGSNPVVHCSQYDKGRVFRFNLFDGSAVVTLDGTETIECNVRKLDGTIVTVAVANTSDSYIDVVTTEQMTAVHGSNFGEIVFKKGSDVIGTVNFILQVEKSPLEGGITSDSSIYNLSVQVANFVSIEVANQYDSANVIFDTVPTSGHGIGYAVTSGGIKNALDPFQQQIFNRSDVLLNVMGGTLRGFGSASVYMQNGVARIDFNIKVSVDETVSNVGTWGINRDYFIALTGKTITPLEGGIVTYYHNEQVYTSRVDFGGTFLVTGQFWKPARVYDDNGTKKVGGWNSNVFASGDRFIGTCYGSYT